MMALPDFSAIQQDGNPVDLARYWEDMQRWQAKLQSNMLRSLLLAAACFIGGLIALFMGWHVVAVVLVAAAAYLNGDSTQNQLIHDMNQRLWALALLIERKR